ncbi:MAG: chalcone isomerase family protein [Gammaproteobacteria bacterium]
MPILMRSRLKTRQAVVLVLACLAGYLAAARAADIPNLPPPVIAAAPQLHLLGHGPLNYPFLFFHVHIYDAALYVTGMDWNPDAPYALAVTYARSFSGKSIADEGVKQLRRLGYTDEDDLRRWNQDMVKAFPEVHKGDTLVGLYLPAGETRFYLNGKLTGDIKDPSFGPAFFSMWLSPKTSDPRLRKVLLNLQGQA